MVYTVNFTMNVVDNIGSKIRQSVILTSHWKRHCEFSLICDSIFNSENRILMRIEILNFTVTNENVSFSFENSRKVLKCNLTG